MAQNIYEKILAQFLTEGDPIFAMLEWMVKKMIEIESQQKVGAQKGKHSRGRKTYFSGTRVRRFDTRMGTMYLLIPKVRKGGYVPFFVTEKKRSEQALMSMIREAFVNGVSTRKVERVAKKLGIENISSGQVSMINKQLNEDVQRYRNRKLDRLYPFVWVDALYEKIRDNGRVISMAILVVYGVNREGKREILAIEPMYQETEDNWRMIFKNIKDRGVEKICYIVSDAHAGIQSAVKKEFLGCSWQRCKVHFMRNILARVSSKDKKSFADKLKQIWRQPDKQMALKVAELIMEEYQDKYPKAVKCLEEGLEDTLSYYDYPEVDHRKISSTNVLERLFREIRRRTKVIGIFPSKDSYIRLVTTLLIEYSEDWEVERSYIKKDILDIVIGRFEKLIKAA